MSINNWVIQSTFIPRDITDKIFNLAVNKGIAVKDISTIPFTKKILNWEQLPKEKFFLNSGVKIIDIIFDDNFNIEESFNLDKDSDLENATKIYNHLKNQIWYDPDNFSQSHYSQFVKFKLLNNDALYFKLGSVLTTTFDKPYFIKPSSDLKLFSAGVVEVGETLKQCIESKPHNSDYINHLDDLVLLTNPKITDKEYRLFIVNDEIVTGSRYAVRNSFNKDKYIPNEVLVEARELIKLFKPAKGFVMDVCIINDEVKIVEYNCIHCSGFYDSDIGLFIDYLKQKV